MARSNRAADDSLLGRAATRSPAATTPIVGVGASAGGLEAFTQLLRELPVDTGLAFVLVQHLDPKHESMLTAILSRATRMPVTEVKDGTRAEPNQVYVIPPNTNLAISEGLLHLTPRSEAPGLQLPVDYFFRSLAADQKDRAIGIILSGTASDGAQGMAAIKAEGGITFAQDEASAAHHGMPASAIAAGCVDRILPPDKIALELARISRLPYAGYRPAADPEESLPASGDRFQEIFPLLQRATGINFRYYKPATIQRRLARRMLLHQIEDLDAFLAFLRQNPAEVLALGQDLLITVTSFFREPEAFEVLRDKVFPLIAKRRSGDAPIRVWVPACSTGEEVYSIAICLLEFLGERNVPVQIFGTDLSETAVEQARAGKYPASIEADVSPERLQRFFLKSNGGYRINKRVRDLCIFAKQDVTKDPPFSNLDLVSCRNMLIYLGPALQSRAVSAFHYALKPRGFLVLGKAETLGPLAEMFEQVDKKRRVYSKQSSSPGAGLELLVRETAPRRPVSKEKAAKDDPALDLHQEADRIVVARYGPAGFVVNERLEILKFRGRAKPYLDPSAGDAGLNVSKMVPPGLAVAIRAAVHQAKKKNAVARKNGIRITHIGPSREINIVAIPLNRRRLGTEPCFLVLFEEVKAPVRSVAKAGKGERGITQQKVLRWKRELAAAKQELRAVTEESEVNNEELQSANEELQSRNEELQSANEELETAKEELQSANEEITTLNETLQNQNQELTHTDAERRRAQQHAEAIVRTIRHPVLVLDANLRVQTANQSFCQIFQVSAAETQGCYLYDLGNRQWDIPQLRALLEDILPRNTTVEDFEVEWEFEKIGRRTILLNGRRLETEDKGAELILLAMEDITEILERKRAEEALLHQRRWLEDVLDLAPTPMLLIEPGTARVFFANKAASEMAGGQFPLGVPAEEYHTAYYCTDAAGNRIPNEEMPGVRVARGETLDGFEMNWHTPRGIRAVLVFADMVPAMHQHEEAAVLVFQDVTQLKQVEAELRAAHQAKDEFLAMVSHELRTPLTAVLGYSRLLQSGKLDDQSRAVAFEAIHRNAKAQASVIEDLLDVTRIISGKLPLDLRLVTPAPLVQQAVEDARPAAESKGLEISMLTDADEVLVRVDSDRLRQAVSNLISNAIKFTPAGGRIDVRLEVTDSQTRLTVQDTGIGIEPDLLPRVFDRFYQADTSSSGSRHGLGLGLAIAHRLLALQGGTIQAESPGKGQGATFTVTLPLAEPGEADRAKEVSTTQAYLENAARLEGVRVLLVEDDADTRDMLALTLRRCGAEVVATGSAGEALEAIERLRPDVLVSDISMPGEDGYELIRKVRALEQNRGRHLPALALTAYAGEEDRRRALSAGFEMHLAKPVEPAQLSDLIKKLLEKEAVSY